MKKGPTLLILSIIFYSHVCFAGSMEPASQTQLAVSMSDPEARKILNFLKMK